MDRYNQPHHRNPVLGVLTKDWEHTGKGEKPKKQLAIVGWRSVNADLIARHWNGGGDGNYFDKITLMLEKVRQVNPSAEIER